jgi:hypothetical protein
MSGTNLGTKRTCPKCGAKFFDFDKDPIVCPKCSHKFKAEAATKLSRSKGKAVKAAPASAKKKTFGESEEEALLKSMALPDEAMEDAPELEELEVEEDDGPEITSLEEIEEHQEEEEVDADGDDAEDEMYMNELAEESMMDDLEELLEEAEEDDEDEEEEEEDDDEDEDEDDDSPRSRKRR